MSASSRTRAKLDPDIQRFVDDIINRSAELAGAETLSIEQRREIAEAVRAPWAEGGPAMLETREVMLPGTGRRIRIYIPKTGAGAGTLLYLHGGGWMLFSVDTHDRLMREYADRAGCAVVGLDYSLAPEAPFPAALNEVVACLEWIHREGAANGLNTAKVLMGGDSAGGNLSLAAAKKLRDIGGEMPDGLLLNYAALDTERRPSYQLYDGEPYMLNISEMEEFWETYVSPSERDNPYARVLLGDLTGLPATHLCIAECDILLDENKELQIRLDDAGVEVSSNLYEGATHSFLEAVSISSCAQRAISDAAVWIKRIVSS